MLSPARRGAPAHGDLLAAAEAAVAEIRRFLTHAWADRDEDVESERVLVTILLIDIVGSTAKAIELGDTRSRETHCGLRLAHRRTCRGARDVPRSLRRQHAAIEAVDRADGPG